MNKQKLIDIDKAVESKRGLIGKGNESADVVLWDGNEFYLVSAQYAKTAHAMGDGDVICTIDEYTQRARELGWVNGYKWGVEYPTSGNKPDLPDDTIVSVFIEGAWLGDGHGSDQCWTWSWLKTEAFKVIDKRYKPKAEPLGNSEQSDNSWHEREELPPVGVEVEVKHNGSWVGATVVGEFGTLKKCAVCAPNGGGFFGFYLDEIRPLKSEREKFIDAACLILAKNPTALPSELMGMLYDAGFRAPEAK